jgi:hypothetical protein
MHLDSPWYHDQPLDPPQSFAAAFVQNYRFSPFVPRLITVASAGGNAAAAGNDVLKRHLADTSASRKVHKNPIETPSAFRRQLQLRDKVVKAKSLPSPIVTDIECSLGKNPSPAEYAERGCGPGS